MDISINEYVNRLPCEVYHTVINHLEVAFTNKGYTGNEYWDLLRMSSHIQLADLQETIYIDDLIQKG